MTTLLWKLARLRVMSWQEIFWRARQFTHAHLELVGFGRARTISMLIQELGNAWLVDSWNEVSADPYVAAAKHVLAGRFDVFELHGADIGFPPRWNRDPKTGTEAPLVFGKTLNYRDERIVGDIKYLWEPNRHLELVTLSQAWHLTGEMKYADGCRTLLESWFEQCPYPLGVNWTSSLEHSVRLVNWAVTWHLLSFKGRDSRFKVQGSRFNGEDSRDEGVFAGERRRETKR